MTTVGAVAVVAMCAVGDEPKGLLSSPPLRDAGGLLGDSSDLRRDLMDEREDDSLPSAALCFENGGGILMLERSAEALVASAWADFLSSGALLAARRECVDGVLPPLSRGAGAPLDALDDEVTE